MRWGTSRRSNSVLRSKSASASPSGVRSRSSTHTRARSPQGRVARRDRDRRDGRRSPGSCRRPSRDPVGQRRPRAGAQPDLGRPLLVVAPPALVDAVVIGDRAGDQGFDLGRRQTFGGGVKAMPPPQQRQMADAVIVASVRRPSSPTTPIWRDRTGGRAPAARRSLAGPLHSSLARTFVVRDHGWRRSLVNGQSGASLASRTGSL